MSENGVDADMMVLRRIRRIRRISSRPCCWTG